ncbi:hypothetical protein KYK30_20395 [Shinella yambaruensis]|nr:hypothetical protein [Shinella yambaruensis]MCU7982063.1 hypothetical protein [Shinella yambaruensis]
MSDFLRPEKPSFSACYRRMHHAARKYSWSPIPSESSLRRRMLRVLAEQRSRSAPIVIRRER